LPKWPWEYFQEADFWFFVVSVGESQGVIFYAKALGVILWSPGLLAVSISATLPPMVLLEVGFGLLLTQGTPTGQQVLQFLQGFTATLDSTPGVGIGLIYSPSVDTWAWTFQVANGVGISLGGSIGIPLQPGLTIPQTIPQCTNFVIPFCPGIPPTTT
jgi:hypothetical protein